MQFERIVDLDLAQGRAATLDLGPMLYQDDINSIKLGVRLRNGSDPVEVEGTVVGRALLSNGATIPIESGDKEGSEAWVVIPQAALEVPGRVEYFMRIYDTDTTAVALYAYGYVRRTTTGTIIVPGDPLPDVEQLRQIAADCEAATETAQGVVDTAVQYTAQTKTDAQKAQARENIGAASAELPVGAGAFFAGQMAGSGTVNVNRKQVTVSGNHVHMEGMGAGSSSGTYAIFNTLGTPGGVSGTYSEARVKSLFTSGYCYTADGAIFPPDRTGILRIAYMKQSDITSPVAWEFGVGLYTYDAATDTLTAGYHKYNLSESINESANGPAINEVNLSADFMEAVRTNKTLAFVIYGKTGAQWLSSKLDIYWEIIPAALTT